MGKLWFSWDDLMKLWMSFPIEVYNTWESWMCFTCFKCKIIKNRWKTHKVCKNWQFQSLIFQKLSNLVPSCSKNLKKSSKVLLNQKVTQLVLWWKVSQNVKFSPWTLKIVKNGPWDIKNFEKNKFCPCTNLLWQDWSLIESLVKITQMVPEVWKFDDFSPWWK